MKDYYCKIIESETKEECVAELKFHPTRRWRFDYAIPTKKIAIEVEGGAWTRGRHTRGKGFIGDMEKYNQAVLLGWRLVRCTPQQKLTSKFLNLIKELSLK